MHTKIPQNMRMQKVGPEHLEQFNNLLRYAFQVTEEDLSKIGWESDDIRQSKFPILESADVLGWFEGDKLASQIAVYPMEMNIHDAVYNIGFVTGVATYPEYSGMGLMSRLMKRSLTEMRERGQSISLLFPYSIPLYRRKGWEIISDKMTFSVKDFQLPQKLVVPGTVRRVTEDCPDLIELHDRFARHTHGCLFRNTLAWEEYWRWDADDTTVAVYYDEPGRAMGYMVYLLSNEILHVKEMVYMNLEAWKGLWNYITAHESMIVEVRGDNFSNVPIAFWLDDSDIQETIRPYIMARVVDFEQFIAQYNFSDADRNDMLTFEVADPLLEWNNRSFTVRFSESAPPELVGSEKSGESGPASKKVSLTVGTLTTMLMGYKRPAYLHAWEYLKADAPTLALLEDVIPQDKTYISDYI